MRWIQKLPIGAGCTYSTVNWHSIDSMGEKKCPTVKSKDIKNVSSNVYGFLFTFWSVFRQMHFPGRKLPT